jgi:hypothetical protein
MSKTLTPTYIDRKALEAEIGRLILATSQSLAERMNEATKLNFALLDVALGVADSLTGCSTELYFESEHMHPFIPDTDYLGVARDLSEVGWVPPADD